MGTGGIPTTDNMPETTEIFEFPIDNIPDNRFFKRLNFIIFIWNKTIISVVSGILSVVGIPTVPIPIPEEIQLLMYDRKFWVIWLTFTQKRCNINVTFGKKTKRPKFFKKKKIKI